jgi:hypothetical protein
VHPTGGSLRVFKHFAWLGVDSDKMAFSHPAHQPVTQAVGQPESEHMKTEITAYILTRLSRAASEDDIIYSVCQRTGLDWDDAYTLVAQVKSEHIEEIEVRQTPIKSLLSSTFFLLGIVLIVGPILYLWVMLDVTRTFLLFMSDPSAMNAESAFRLIGSRCALLGWFQLPSIIFPMLGGLGIIYTNLQAMGKIWETLFRRWNVID